MDPPLQRIVSIFPQAIASIDIANHKLAFIGYLEYYGLAHEQVEDRLVVKEDGGAVLTATFDELNRLTKLQGTLGRKQQMASGVP